MVNTIHWAVDKNVDNLDSYPHIQQAATELQNTNVVAFPTETVYGLGGSALSDRAIERIYSAKGRPSDNPLIVHIANNSQLDELVPYIPEQARKLMEAFWPGPLTIVLPTTGRVSDRVTAGLNTVAIRMPDHPVALALIKAAGLPLAAPSANASGKPSPTTAAHVLDDLDGKIAGVVDGGATGIGVESTVIDCTVSPAVLLRPGGITQETIEETIGSITVNTPSSQRADQPKSPGMKYTHYSPDAPMYLVNGGSDVINQYIKDARNDGKKIGVITTEEDKEAYQSADVIEVVGSRRDLSTIATGLYHAVRAFNQHHVDVIFCETFPEEGIGVAIMNRLSKASGGRTLSP
ncbi:L-threonylcarbamoyladenylate synthase [Tuberibacillus sp. Marseille-P3662]|uniref:L-threonylcarbamoyladenylate synthase n=1 Tax=Tuberibacillus sp. Marseille-P3662 TaxID=1965358 RepID=UPI000A1CC4CD|nr:L-threonylcarbamoyladenylate synthase [Tuberibacillus sp. Marseille-P3662]